jgi:hypothetical protein
LADRRSALRTAAVLAAFVAACASQVASPPDIERRGPAEFPDAYYRQLLAQGKPVFRVDPLLSLVVIEVRRGGSLARFGHDHVVASHDVTGNIAADEGRADLYVPLDALVIDEPALRADAGFDTQPDADDIAGTRRNMLEKVLDTARYPYALIRVTDVSAAGSGGQVGVALTLHGATVPVVAAVQWDKSADELSATGEFAIAQTQFGITPLSLLSGAISVQDRVNITFRIRAQRLQGDAR